MPQTTPELAEPGVSGRVDHAHPTHTPSGAPFTTGRALGEHSRAPVQVTPTTPLCPPPGDEETKCMKEGHTQEAKLPLHASVSPFLKTSAWHQSTLLPSFGSQF